MYRNARNDDLFIFVLEFQPMTYYHKEVERIRDEYFPAQHIIKHLILAKKFIDENFCSEIDLQAISGSSFLSKFHFIRLFKRCYGVTPHKYLTEKRMERARRLLASDRTVTDTCFEIGFDSRNSFSAVFKKYTGVSPADYKKQFSIRLSGRSAPILHFNK
jgi:AraC-like DNA-binding protein